MSGFPSDPGRYDLREEALLSSENKEVPCEFAGCAARVSLDRFDESIWLPVFKSSREHLGFFCPLHVKLVREKKMEARYLLSRTGPDEIIIDRLPLRPDPQNLA